MNDLQTIRQDPKRTVNRFLILKEILQSGSISRIELAERTGRSRALVTNITAELIEQNIIWEKEASPSEGKGRRRVQLALNAEAAFVVGIKVLSTHVSIAVTDFQANLRSSVFIPVQAGVRPVTHLVDIIEDGMRHCLKEAKLNNSLVCGIGLAIPGFVDSQTGRCYWTPLYDEAETSLRDLIHKRFNVPTYIENDAKALTLYEQWFGQGQGVDSFLVLTLERGVGMGIVANGSLYRGGRGIGSEFAHIIMEPGGALCRCGKKGCIEAYSGGIGILRAAREAHEAGKWKHPDVSTLTVEDIIARAQKAEPELKKILQKAGRMLGRGLAAMVQVFNPAKIIITGQYVNAGNLMFSPMKSEISRLVNPEIYNGTELVFLEWMDANWAKGAASLVLQEIYKSPQSFIASPEK